MAKVLICPKRIFTRLKLNNQRTDAALPSLTLPRGQEDNFLCD